MDESFAVVVELEEGYAFRASFPGKTYDPLSLDEPAPLGADAAPNAARVLAASVGGCLAASLLLCLRKSHDAPRSVRAEVAGQMARNENGKWRISSLAVTLHVAGASEEKLARCVRVFEEYCIVTQSVRQGVDVRVQVKSEP